MYRAIDSRPFETTPGRTPEAEPAGQGVWDEPRQCDYGPGWTFGGSATWNRNGQAVLAGLYEGRTVYSLDGIRANHGLHRVRADLVVPVRRAWGIGVTGEYFARFSLYQEPRRTRRAYR